MGWFYLFLIAVFVLAIVLIIVMMNKRTDRAAKAAQEQALARLVEPERMQVVHNNNSTIIYRDAQTGVQYLVVSRGWHGVSVTPMLNLDGKPLQG